MLVQKMMKLYRKVKNNLYEFDDELLNNSILLIFLNKKKNIYVQHQYKKVLKVFE
jgi:hypothetical protein